MRECLTEVFNIDSSPTEDCIQPGLVVDLFRSLAVNEPRKVNLSHGDTPANTFSSSHAENAVDASHSETSRTQVFAFCIALFSCILLSPFRMHVNFTSITLFVFYIF